MPCETGASAGADCTCERLFGSHCRKTPRKVCDSGILWNLAVDGRCLQGEAGDRQGRDKPASHSTRLMSTLTMTEDPPPPTAHSSTVPPSSSPSTTSPDGIDPRRFTDPRWGATPSTTPPKLKQRRLATSTTPQSTIATFLTWTIASFIAISSWFFPFLPVASWLQTPPPAPTRQLTRKKSTRVGTEDARSPIVDEDVDDLFEAAASSMVRRRPSRGLKTGTSTEESSDSPGLKRRGSRLKKKGSRDLVGLRAMVVGGPVGPPVRKAKVKTLVLDLDETLIHSTSSGSRYHDHMIEVLVDKHRPYADLFLRKVSEWYKVVIFTASMPEYADPVIDWLDTNRNLISRRFFRESCTLGSGGYMKNLSIIEPDLSQVCLVDNAPVSYAINQDNGIPIENWTSDVTDEALLDLLPFLDALRFCDDVRSVLSLRV
ncbi:Nuclear envelope morphology protein 1 [Dinochytrium kinnereticum]|nr:Nuclear envelope morphology protein 1 [Dinochytrium kinnereticum]